MSKFIEIKYPVFNRNGDRNIVSQVYWLSEREDEYPADQIQRMVDAVWSLIRHQTLMANPGLHLSCQPIEFDAGVGEVFSMYPRGGDEVLDAIVVARIKYRDTQS